MERAQLRPPLSLSLGSVSGGAAGALRAGQWEGAECREEGKVCGKGSREAELSVKVTWGCFSHSTQRLRAWGRWCCGAGRQGADVRQGGGRCGGLEWGVVRLNDGSERYTG